MVNFSGGIFHVNNNLTEDEKVDLSVFIVKLFLEKRIYMKFDENISKWDYEELNRYLSNYSKINSCIKYVLTDNPLVGEVRLLFAPDSYTYTLNGKTFKNINTLSNKIKNLSYIFRTILNKLKVYEITFLMVNEWDGENKKINIRIEDFEYTMLGLFNKDGETDGDIIINIKQ